MGDGLHIKVIKNNENQSSFDASFGLLKLSAAGVFQITVEEFGKRKKQIDSDFAEAEKFARDKWNERANAGWTKAKLLENWSANETQRNTKKTASNTDLEKDYKDVNWIWVVAPKQLQANELSHNDSFSKGIKGSGIQNLKFPKVLEGGGLAYVEAFQPADGAKGKKPFGVFVQATGKPKIVRVEWTDFEYNLLKGKVVAFNSEVLLHIYTEALYGQELEIQLFDEDIFRDDELNISEKSNFQREVNIHKVHPKEVGKPGIADTLVKGGQDTTDKVIEKENYLQKITIEVKVDFGWMKLAGGHLKIYPTVKSLKTGEYFENFSREFLEVAMNGVLYDVPKEITNMPVVVSEISTNIANYHPCQYTEIGYVDPKGVTNIVFQEKPQEEQNPNLEVGIIVGSDPKKFTLKVDDKADTAECRFDKTPKNHDKNIFTYDKTKLPKNIIINDHQTRKISGEASFSYNLTDLPKYFWLSETNSRSISILNIDVDTCRHQNKIKLMIVPEIEWTINFFYNTPDPVWYGQSEPTYDIYGTESTAVRDNTGIGDIKNSKDRVALADLKREENIANANVKGGKTKIATTANQFYGDRKSTYGLSVKATYDGGKSQELSFKFWEKYRKPLMKLNSVYDLVDRIAGAKDAREASKTLPPSLVGRRNLMSLSLLPPAPSVGVGWKYVYENNKVGIELTGKFKCAPLIGGDLKIDLLALADKIPLYGKLVTALDLATWLAEKIAFNKLSINYRIDLTFYASLAIEEAFVKYNNAKEKGNRLSLDSKVSGTFGGKLEISFDIKTKVNTEVDISFEAGLKADCYFKITASPNANWDNMIDWTTKFSGLIVTGYYKFSIGRKGSNDAPKSFDPFKLIPSYTGTPISMKFGEGE